MTQETTAFRRPGAPSRRLAAAWTALLVWALCRASAAELFSNVLLNAGFELGDGDLVISNWVPFNEAHRYPANPHSGAYAMCMWGPWNPGNWDASGVYQDYPVHDGEIWEASVWAMVTSNLQEQGYGALVVRMLNADTQVIFDGMSPGRITAATPTGQWFRLTAKVQATPSAAFVRAQPSFIKPPDYVTGHCWFDDAELYMVPTSHLRFAGRDWMVLDAISSPGMNYYSTNCVSVDSNGWLHMTVRQIDGTWYCPFLECADRLGFGEYRWYTGSKLDQVDSNLVVGLFFWAQEPVYGTNQIEVDIEVSHAFPGTQTNCLVYTVQPYNIPGISYQHPMVMTNDLSTHRFIWRPDRVDWESYYGHLPAPDTSTTYIAGWRFEGHGIPIETNERPFMNFWLFYTNAPRDTQGLEIVICDFAFEPFDGFLLTDEFGGAAVSSIWSLVGTDDPSASVTQTNGRLAIVPPAGGAAAGCATADLIHRNERGTWYVFSAVLSTATVTAAAAGDDVRALLGFCNGTNVPLAAVAAATLQGRYDEADDTLALVFFTKTNAPGDDGTRRYEGLLTNAAARMAAGGVEMRMELDPGEYRVAARDAGGQPLGLSDTFGSSTGFHGLGETLSNGYWFVGAANSGASSSGTVAWARASLGIGGQAQPSALTAPRASADEFTFSSPAFFDTRCDVYRTTNMALPFAPWRTNLAVPSSPLAITDSVEGVHRAFYRLEFR